MTNEQWERLEPLLPPEKPKTGQPGHVHHHVRGGILWVLRTGVAWRDLPERHSPWGTAASRLGRWRKAVTWDRVLAELQQQADAEGELDWSVHFVDGTTLRVHQHTADAKGGAQPARR